MPIPVIDSLAWYLVRLLGIVQNLVASLVLSVYTPNLCEREGYKIFSFLTGMLFGGLLISQAKSSNDLPKMMAERLIVMGRVLLMLVFITLFNLVLDGITNA